MGFFDDITGKGDGDGLFGGKNSFFRKPFGTGSGSFAQAVGFEAPDVEEVGLSASDAAREKFLAQTLERGIRGDGKSLAVEQYKQAQEDQLKNAMSMASTNQNVSNPALLARNIQQAKDGQDQQLAQDSSMLRLQEQKGFIDSMNQYFGNKYGVSQANAQMQNQNNQNTANRFNSFIGNMGSAAATIAASDKDLKKDIKKSDSSAGDKIDEFLSALESYEFNYKDKKHGEGEHSGVMAQDLEKTELGKQMIKDTPEGKMVDFGQGFGAILASMAELRDEMKSVKEKKNA